MHARSGRATLQIAAAIAFASTCLSVRSFSAQDQTTPFRTEANYVRLDVYPTSGGQPVSDLTRQDFEVFENGAPQTIEQFERVLINTGGVQDTRSEPSTVDASRQAAADPRARVFVLFLDVEHVEGIASQTVRTALIGGLNRLIGPGDLIAVMTPDMSARELTFSRRTTMLEGLLTTAWGGRDRAERKDDTEEQYARCYPGIPGGRQQVASDRGIAQEMILRRREKRTLDALQDTVRVLRGLREERKAVLVITDGWQLFTPAATLVRPIDNAPPPIAPLGVDPRTGKVTVNPTTDLANSNPSICERDRLALANLDNAGLLRDIEGEANRANTSFYPIDPRGLVVFDEQILPSAGVGVGRAANPVLSPDEERRRLAARRDSLLELAEATDGLALVGTNGIAAGIRRIADDLNAYYLLGYYSTGTLDGTFHSIRVRVRRPGVEVRARRGFLALRPPETSNASPAVIASPDVRAVETALGSLVALARPQSLLVRVAAGWTPGSTARVWIVAEPARPSLAGNATSPTAVSFDAFLTDSRGATVATARGQLESGARSTRLALALPTPAVPGDYTVGIRVRGPDAATASNESMPVRLATTPSPTSALLFRRGPTTGNTDVPTADVRFRRSERLRVEIPDPSDGVVTARLLDRRAQALAVPVAAAVRTDSDGVRWQTAELALAPLAPGDYVVELSHGSVPQLIAFRVIP